MNQKTRETAKLEKRSEENKMECDSTRLLGEVLLPAIKRRATVIAVREKKGSKLSFISWNIPTQLFQMFLAFIAVGPIFEAL